MKIRSKAAGMLAAGMLAGSLGTAMTMGSLTAGGAVVHYKVVYQKFIGQTGTSSMADVKCPSGMVPVSGGAHVGYNSFYGGNTLYAYVGGGSVDAAHTGWSTLLVVVAPQGSTAFTASAVCATW